VDLLSQGLLNSFCWCWARGPAVNVVDMFSSGFGPHGFSIGLGSGHSRLASTVIEHILFNQEDPTCQVDAEHDAEHNIHWTTYFVSVSFALVSLGGDNMLHFSPPPDQPRPESNRPLELTPLADKQNRPHPWNSPTPNSRPPGSATDDSTLGEHPTTTVKPHTIAHAQPPR
jgi:hypothetical protein